MVQPVEAFMDTLAEMRREVARANFEAERSGAPRQLLVDLEGALAALASEPQRGPGLKQLLERGRVALERWQDWRAVRKRSGRH